MLLSLTRTIYGIIIKVASLLYTVQMNATVLQDLISESELL